MAITIKDLRAKFAEFKDCDQGLALEAIEEAELNINADAWSVRADLGAVYLAAHLLKIALKADAIPGGPISQLKTSDVSASYAAPRIDPAVALSFGTLMQTVYGRRYFELRRQIFASRVI